MSEIKNFEFKSAKASANVIGSFQINGENFEVRALKDTRVAYLVRDAQRRGRGTKIISSVLTFMEDALTAESLERFEPLAVGGGDTGHDGLDLNEIVEVFEHVLSIVSSGGETESKPTRAPRKPRSTANLKSV